MTRFHGQKRRNERPERGRATGSSADVSLISCDHLGKCPTLGRAFSKKYSAFPSAVADRSHLGDTPTVCRYLDRPASHEDLKI